MTICDGRRPSTCSAGIVEVEGRPIVRYLAVGEGAHALWEVRAREHRGRPPFRAEGFRDRPGRRAREVPDAVAADVIGAAGAARSGDVERVPGSPSAASVSHGKTRQRTLRRTRRSPGWISRASLPRHLHRGRAAEMGVRRSQPNLRDPCHPPLMEANGHVGKVKDGPRLPTATQHDASGADDTPRRPSAMPEVASGSVDTLFLHRTTREAGSAGPAGKSTDGDRRRV